MVRALGPAVYHVHLKDTQVVAEQVAIAGVLDQRPFDDPAQRAWVFRTAGAVHDVDWWTSFVVALREVGYDDVLSIENEDASLPPEASVEQAARFMAPILATTGAALVLYYGRTIARDRSIRNLVLACFLGAFAVASLAALIGSLVTRAAPIR